MTSSARKSSCRVFFHFQPIGRAQKIAVIGNIKRAAIQNSILPNAIQLFAHIHIEMCLPDTAHTVYYYINRKNNHILEDLLRVNEA